MDMVYILPHTAADTRKTFKHRIYDVLIRMHVAKYGTPELRIVRKYPGIPWRRIWTNLHASVVVKSGWFAAINDIVATNDRLVAIRLTNTIAENRTPFNTPLPNVRRDGSSGLGREPNWG